MTSILSKANKGHSRLDDLNADNEFANANSGSEEQSNRIMKSPPEKVVDTPVSVSKQDTVKPRVAAKQDNFDIPYMDDVDTGKSIKDQVNNHRRDAKDDEEEAKKDEAFKAEDYKILEEAGVSDLDDSLESLTVVEKNDSYFKSKGIEINSLDEKEGSKKETAYLSDDDYLNSLKLRLSVLISDISETRSSVSSIKGDAVLTSDKKMMSGINIDKHISDLTLLIKDTELMYPESKAAFQMGIALTSLHQAKAKLTEKAENAPATQSLNIGD